MSFDVLGKLHTLVINNYSREKDFTTQLYSCKNITGQTTAWCEVFIIDYLLTNFVCNTISGVLFYDMPPLKEDYIKLSKLGQSVVSLFVCKGKLDKEREEMLESIVRLNEGRQTFVIFLG